MDASALSGHKFQFISIKSGTWFTHQNSVSESPSQLSGLCFCDILIKTGMVACGDAWDSSKHGCLSYHGVDPQGQRFKPAPNSALSRNRVPLRKLVNGLLSETFSAECFTRKIEKKKFLHKTKGLFNFNMFPRIVIVTFTNWILIVTKKSVYDLTTDTTVAVVLWA